MRLKFDYAYQGLAFRNPAEANRLFSVAGKDRRFQWAEARIENTSEVVVGSNQVPEPEIVVYQFATPLYHGLINSAGLPAFPFRTADLEHRVSSKLKVPSSLRLAGIPGDGIVRKEAENVPGEESL